MRQPFKKKEEKLFSASPPHTTKFSLLGGSRFRWLAASTGGHRDVKFHAFKNLGKTCLPLPNHLLAKVFVLLFVFVCVVRPPVELDSCGLLCSSCLFVLACLSCSVVSSFFVSLRSVVQERQYAACVDVAGQCPCSFLPCASESGAACMQQGYNTQSL